MRVTQCAKTPLLIPFTTYQYHHLIKWLFLQLALAPLMGHLAPLAQAMLTLPSLKGAKDFSLLHDIEPDAYLDPPAFIRSRHYECEEHYITTPDGYILALHRIINPKVPKELRHQLRPVLLMHGLLTSSFNYIIASDKNRDRPMFNGRDLWRTHSPGQATPVGGASNLLDGWFNRHDQEYVSDAMGFLLANSAYDIWMGNLRGSTYSLNHTHLDHEHDQRYWDFSFHEMAIYDLPAMIDYVLLVRGRRSLGYVGHSQGNLIMFILQSLQPDWGAKVRPFIAMAPIAFIPNVYFGLPRLLLQFVDTTRLNERLKGQIAPKTAITQLALDMVCRPKASEPWCDIILALMLGNNLLRQNQTRTAVVAHHIPEGTSILNALHFLQAIKRGTFESFDFGPRGNLMRYGTFKNPRYPIERLQSPDICLIHSTTDTLATKTNYQLTKARLKVRLIDDYEVPEKVWGHSDYIYGKGSGKLVNLHVRSVLDRYRLVP